MHGMARRLLQCPPSCCQMNSSWSMQRQGFFPMCEGLGRRSHLTYWLLLPMCKRGAGAVIELWAGWLAGRPQQLWKLAGREGGREGDDGWGGSLHRALTEGSLLSRPLSCLAPLFPLLLPYVQFGWGTLIYPHSTLFCISTIIGRIVK